MPRFDPGSVGKTKGAVGRPRIAPVAPQAAEVTDYDRQHFFTYAQLVFADDAGEDWRQSARRILGLDVGWNEQAARRCWQSHSRRAHWIATEGYQLLLLQAGIAKAH